MSELLLELFSEEIPARMQPAAEAALADGLKAAFAEKNLPYENITTYSTPRRIAAVVTSLPVAQEDNKTERKGPQVGAPEQALQGFLKSTGLSKDQLEVRDVKGKNFYFAVVEEKGRPTADLLKDIIKGLLAAFPWPKSMRWGSGEMRWVRPLHNICCLFDGKVVPVEFSHLTASNQTGGHRFLAPKAITVTSAEDWLKKLRAAHVEPDRTVRKAAIEKAAYEAAEKHDVILREDPTLLEEVTGLVEAPFVVLGSFDKAFLDVPPEALVTSMRSHQKYFALEDGNGKLAPYFITIANVPGQGDNAIAKGNERVLSARLSDARFFWEQDKKIPLEQRNLKLKDVVFHAKLGSVDAKVERITALAGYLSDYIPGASKDAVLTAANLCKADLMTDMVGEFPELQGIMGGYYAAHEGLSADVCTAIKEHYAPQGPNDSCPTAPVSVAVALADKLDTLVAMFAIGEKPTGSKDPYALRRAALGIIRLILENRLRLPLKKVVDCTLTIIFENLRQYQVVIAPPPGKKHSFTVQDEILDFIADRLKVSLKEKNFRHDHIAAVFATGEDDLGRLVARVEALQSFLGDEVGGKLLGAYRRAGNIVTKETQKDGKLYAADAAEAAKAEAGEESQLFEKLASVEPAVYKACEQEAYELAMAELATLQAPVDAFFDKVTVNADNPAVRENRLCLLARIQGCMNRVADFGKIEG